jgi:AAA family ATP:ADP antiporter
LREAAAAASSASKEVFGSGLRRIRRSGRFDGGILPSGLGIGLPTVRAQAASAAAAAEDGALPSQNVITTTPKKFFGVETTTLKKVLPLGFMFFCILFNYTILRDTKDVLVVTAKGSSAEIIPFLKTWVNLPMAIGFMIIYTKLSNVLSKEQLFYSCIFPFIAFFGTFAFFMYPVVDFLHPTAFADFLVEKLGTRFLGPIAIIRNWTFVLFYVMAELWGSVVVSVLFWGFANQITTVDEAKQFYPLFGLGANVALVFSGRTVKYFSKLRTRLPPGVDGWGYSLKGMMGLVVILGLAIVGIYWWVNKYVVNDPTLPKAEARKKVCVSYLHYLEKACVSDQQLDFDLIRVEEQLFLKNWSFGNCKKGAHESADELNRTDNPVV